MCRYMRDLSLSPRRPLAASCSRTALCSSPVPLVCVPLPPAAGLRPKERLELIVRSRLEPIAPLRKGFALALSLQASLTPIQRLRTTDAETTSAHCSQGGRP